MTILDRIANWLERRELAVLRKQLQELHATEKERFSRVSYLESRDALCSSMANTINKQAFEIATLKGNYSKTSDRKPE